MSGSAELLRAAVNWAVTSKVWMYGAVGTANLSELEMTLGELSQAAKDAERSVGYADQGDSTFWQVVTRTIEADAQQQLGRWGEAEKLFRKAEQMQAEVPHKYSLLYGLLGFRYCDLLLTPAERAAWQRTLEHYLPPLSKSNLSRRSGSNSRHYKTFNLVSRHAIQTLEWVKKEPTLSA